MKKSQVRIVTFGGGTGHSVMLSGLKRAGYNLSAIVNMADDGGSSGRLRKSFGVLPPGDIRQCLAALAHADRDIQELFNYRFLKGDLGGHTFGNIFLASLEKSLQNTEEAIKIAESTLKVRGKVIPVTTANTNLYLKMGAKIIRGTVNIYETNLLRGAFHLYLKPQAAITSGARKAIEKADYIIVSPGNLYCSILPVFLVRGFKEAVKKSRAKIIFVSNLANIKWHTDNFSLENYISIFKKYLKTPISYLIFNKNIDFVNKHSQHGGAILIQDRKNFQETKIIKKDLVNTNLYKKDKSDILDRTLVRHDALKLLKAIREIIQSDFRIPKS